MMVPKWRVLRPVEEVSVLRRIVSGCRRGGTRGRTFRALGRRSMRLGGLTLGRLRCVLGGTSPPEIAI